MPCESDCKFALGRGDAENMSAEIPAQAQPIEHLSRGETRLLSVHTKDEYREVAKSDGGTLDTAPALVPKSASRPDMPPPGYHEVAGP